MSENQTFGPCSCQDSGKCRYVNGGPACMNEDPAQQAQPETIYAWFVPDGDTLRIRKWDTKPFPEGTAYSSTRSETVLKPVAYIEHHKGGDNLVWEKTGLPCTPLYKKEQQ